jgi:hypothetical protein
MKAKLKNILDRAGTWSATAVPTWAGVKGAQEVLRVPPGSPLKRTMMKRLFPLVCSLVLWVPSAFAVDAYSDWGYITWLSTGWYEDTMSVITTAPLANLNCPVTDAGYATNPSDPGHQLHHAALLGAYYNHKRVQILVDGCVYDKPRILAVNVQD